MFTTASSAIPPYGKTPNTLSPSLKNLTSEPTALMTPEISLPGVNGRSGRIWYLPCIISVSGKLMAQALTLMSTYLGPGSLEVTSLYTRFSGGPKVSQTMAFILFFV